MVTLPRVRWRSATIKRYYVWRERVPVRQVHVLAGCVAGISSSRERFVERGWLDDLDDYSSFTSQRSAVIAGTTPPGTLRQIAAERRAERDRFARSRCRC